MAVVGDSTSPGASRECSDDDLAGSLHVGREAEQLLGAEVLQALLAAVATYLDVCSRERDECTVIHYESTRKLRQVRGDTPMISLRESPKFSPLIVSLVPGWPSLGDTPLTTGPCSPLSMSFNRRQR